MLGNGARSILSDQNSKPWTQIACLLVLGSLNVTGLSSSLPLNSTAMPILNFIFRFPLIGIRHHNPEKPTSSAVSLVLVPQIFNNIWVRYLGGPISKLNLVCQAPTETQLGHTWDVVSTVSRLWVHYPNTVSTANNLKKCSFLSPKVFVLHKRAE